MKLNKKGGESINDYTPLILAIRERNVRGVEDLLNMGADPNLKDERERWSPMKWNTYMYLHGPDRNNRESEILGDRITELLVRHGANIMDYDNDNFTYNFSPLVQNQENNSTGGNIHRRKNMKGGFVDIDRTVEERINDALLWHYTPLIDAIINLDTEEVERLLNVENANEVATQVDTEYGWSPMKWASFLSFYVYNHDESQRNDLARIIEILFNAGASADYDNDDMSNDGGYDFSPIIPSVPLLQSDLDSEDVSFTESDTSSEQDRIYSALHGQYTPLINAIIENDPSVVQMLLESASDSNQPDSTYNWSPMKWALFVYAYGIDSQEEDIHYQKQSLEAIIGLLESAGATDVPDEPIDTSKYNFEPVILEQNDGNNNNNNNNTTTGGTRRKQNRKKTTATAIRKLKTMKKRRKSSKKGGSNVTEQTRINDALAGNYTPLINAIIAQRVASVESILENGADPNERDNTYRWCPLKWAAFVFHHNNVHDVAVYRDIKVLLLRNGSHECYDENHIRENSYNFSPVRTDMDALLERRRVQRENTIDNRFRIDTSGGRQSSKHKKAKKSRKSRTKRRKPSKK